MSIDYPVTFDIARPERFSRAQLALRLVVFVLIGMLGISLGAVFILLYLGLPAVVGIGLSGPGDKSTELEEREAPPLVAFLRWVLSAYAWFFLLTDRFPTGPVDPDVHFEVRLGGHPTVGSALARIVLGLPSAFVLALVGILATFLWLVSFLFVLVTERQPAGLHAFQLSVVRWMGRLLAYQASLVEAYPPFTIGPEHGHSAPAAGRA